MKKSGQIALFLIVLILSSVAGFEARMMLRSRPMAELYVSPQGEGQDCSQVEPCSLDAAQEKVRGLVLNMTGDVVVYLRGGEFFLENSLAFGPVDSGTPEHAVTYKAYGKEQDNLVRENEIYRVMQLHDDGAGIYTLSRQPGTRLTENHIYDIRRSEWAEDYPIAAIYLDEQTTDVVVELNTYENVVEPFNFNKIGENTIITINKDGKQVEFKVP